MALLERKGGAEGAASPPRIKKHKNCIDKKEQNEDHALLRAKTSIEKQKMSNRAKMRSDVMKRKDVKTLKGPRS